MNNKDLLFAKRLSEDATLPTKAYSGDAGWDLYCLTDVEIPATYERLIPTGCSFAIPEGYYGRIADRSSLAMKGLHVMGGVVDSKYRGEVKVILHNFNTCSFHFKKGEKIAQMIITKIHTGDMIEVDNLDETERNQGGFGSSGK